MAQIHALLRSLEEADLFSAVGKPFLDSGVKSVTSWQEALSHCLDYRWENVTIKAVNSLTERLSAEWTQLYQNWNPLVREAKQTIIPIVEKKCAKVVKEHHLPKGFVDCVRWDILNACMEQNYAELVTPGFFNILMKWYLRGQFPCGWEGKFPEGELLVF